MTTQKSWNDRLHDAEERRRAEAEPIPVCPACLLELGEEHRLLRRGYARWRCPQCRLEWPAPVPAVDELPALKGCPRCARLGRPEQKLVRVNGMWQWCPACNYEELVLTPAQRARIDAATRRAVGDCYGEPVPHPRFKGRGGGGRSRRRYKNDKRSKGAGSRRPLDGGAAAPVKHLRVARKRRNAPESPPVVDK